MVADRARAENFYPHLILYPLHFQNLVDLTMVRVLASLEERVHGHVAEIEGLTRPGIMQDLRRVIQFEHVRAEIVVADRVAGQRVERDAEYVRQQGTDA